MDDNVTDFMAYKGPAMMQVAGPNGEIELVDLDAWLAERGVDRATVNAIFADHVTNEEEQAPLVAQRQKELEKHRDFMRFLQQWMPQDQAQHAFAIKLERELENEIFIAKCQHIRQLGRGEVTGKPKRKRSRR